MADSKKLVPYIRRWEGGYVNDPLDKGGATNAGVTIATYSHYRKSKGYAVTTIDDLKNMSDNEWHQIFKSLYWDRWMADHIISQSVANILVDWVWGSGKWGVTIPQRILGVTQDGIVGVKTLSALNALCPRTAFSLIRDARVKYIDDICINTPTNERFRKGWMNRLNDLKFSDQ